MLELRDTLCSSVGELGIRGKWVPPRPPRTGHAILEKTVGLAWEATWQLKGFQNEKIRHFRKCLKYIVLTSMRSHNEKVILQVRKERLWLNWIWLLRFIFWWIINEPLLCHIKIYEGTHAKKKNSKRKKNQPHHYWLIMISNLAHGQVHTSRKTNDAASLPLPWAIYCWSAKWTSCPPTDITHNSIRCQVLVWGPLRCSKSAIHICAGSPFVYF